MPKGNTDKQTTLKTAVHVFTSLSEKCINDINESLANLKKVWQ